MEGGDQPQRAMHERWGAWDLEEDGQWDACMTYYYEKIPSKLEIEGDDPLDDWMIGKERDELMMMGDCPNKGLSWVERWGVWD